jgi:hypothetical protein
MLLPLSSGGILGPRARRLSTALSGCSTAPGARILRRDVSRDREASRCPVRSLIRGIRVALPLLAGIAGSAGGAGPATAAVTVGSRLDGRADLVASCRAPAGCTATGALAGRPAAVPSDGVIVRWRLRSATRGTAGLGVLRAAAGGAFTRAATGPRRRLDRRHAAGRDSLYTFSARIPVQRGDVLAVDVGPGPAAVYRLRRGPGYAVSTFQPALAGDETRAPTSVLAGTELLLNADVEADADGDGFGDETQDNCPSIPNDQTTNPCPSTAVPPSSKRTGRGGATSSRTTRFRRHKPAHHGRAVALP